MNIRRVGREEFLSMARYAIPLDGQAPNFPKQNEKKEVPKAI
jgi:hypothetical protein